MKKIYRYLVLVNLITLVGCSGGEEVLPRDGTLNKEAFFCEKQEDIYATSRKGFCGKIMFNSLDTRQVSVLQKRSIKFNQETVNIYEVQLKWNPKWINWVREDGFY